MHSGSSGLRSYTSNKSYSLSAGSSTRSCSVGLPMLTGESGVVARDELELDQRPWLRLEKVGVIGDDALALEAPDDSRECAE